VRFAGDYNVVNTPGGWFADFEKMFRRLNFNFLFVCLFVSLTAGGNYNAVRVPGGKKQKTKKNKKRNVRNRSIDPKHTNDKRFYRRNRILLQAISTTKSKLAAHRVNIFVLFSFVDLLCDCFTQQIFQTIQFRNRIGTNTIASQMTRTTLSKLVAQVR
jgi:hypothetical protein